MDTISNIAKLASHLTTCFIWDFKEHIFIKIMKHGLLGTYTFLAPPEQEPETLVVQTCVKTFS